MKSQPAGFMVGPEQFLASSLWIGSTVLTVTSNHKNVLARHLQPSNKSFSGFGIKALIKEEEEHLSPGGKDRTSASPAPCPQSPPVQVLLPPGSAQPVPLARPILSCPSIALGTYFPVSPHPEEPQGFWQHQTLSQFPREHLHSRNAHKQPAAVSASG